jgi:histidinol dehydrogenase
MKIISASNAQAFAKATQANYDKKLVESIINQVKKDGDLALRKFERKFNGVNLKSLQVSKKEIQDAYKSVTKDQVAAIKLAKAKLAKTEYALKKQLQKITIKTDGTIIEKTFTPLENVGCYAPGGLARYPSSAIMSIIPAKITGVKNIIVASPPNKQGKIDPLVLVAADICGADKIFKVGGAHAIAALAFGTKSIPRVDKIVGPGGPFVTAAKYLVSDTVSIDMLAGPTELAVLADDSADPKLVALDLISQAEHSFDTTCCLITTSKILANKVTDIIKKRITTLPRKNIIRVSLQKNGLAIVCKNMSEAVLVANNLAPEHLEIVTKRPNLIAKQVKTAGLVLLGQNTPSAASDYLLGTNHILPTNRLGKSRGSLSVLDFIKIQTIVQSTRQDLQRIKKPLKTLTDSENLPNHYEAVRSRL